MKVIQRYRLKKDLPGLKRGAIFEHRTYDSLRPDLGSIGCGVMILSWEGGMCQQGWAGETYIFPGQLAKYSEWFEPLYRNEKEKILAEIERLKERVQNLIP